MPNSIGGIGANSEVVHGNTPHAQLRTAFDQVVQLVNQQRARAEAGARNDQNFERRNQELDQAITKMKSENGPGLNFKKRGLYKDYAGTGNYDDKGYIEVTSQRYSRDPYRIDTSGRTGNVKVVSQSNAGDDQLKGANGQEDVFRFRTQYGDNYQSSHTTYLTSILARSPQKRIFQKTIQRSGPGHDIVENFEVGKDKIDLTYMRYEYTQWSKAPKAWKDERGNYYRDDSDWRPYSLDDLDITENEDGDAVINFRARTFYGFKDIGYVSDTPAEQRITESYPASSITVKGVSAEQLKNSDNFIFPSGWRVAPSN